MFIWIQVRYLINFICRNYSYVQLGSASVNKLNLLSE